MPKRSFLAITAMGFVLTGFGGADVSASSSSITGTVPGTVIEAFGDNGSYYQANSVDNGSSRHPFKLKLPAGIGFHVTMITNEGTDEEVVTPIGFLDSQGRTLTRLMLGNGEQVDLGHIPLPMSRNEAEPYDRDRDGLLDAPMVLDDVGAKNPLAQTDVDGDKVNDWDDPDHGGYHYDSKTVDPQDHDGDGVPNAYDIEFIAKASDSDGDGVLNNTDVNLLNMVNPVDLDIQSFKATRKVLLSNPKKSDVVLELKVKNNGEAGGTQDDPRVAIIVGRRSPGNSVVFNIRQQVWDSLSKGANTFTIYPADFNYVPKAGKVEWEVVIDDDDFDDDRETATTIIVP